MSLIIIDEDPWISECNALQRLAQEINNQISERDTKNSPAEYNKISARIRIKLKQFENEMSQLQRKLQQKNSQVTEDEKERRLRELEVLMSRKVQLDGRFHNFPGSSSTRRAQLLTDSSSTFDNEQDDHEILNTNKNTSIEAYRQEQKQILKQQDDGLENLSKVISRQKKIAMTIGNELEDQNVILEGIAEHMDNTDSRVQRATQNVGEITVKDNTCGYWIVIIGLFVAIIIVGIL